MNIINLNEVSKGQVVLSNFSNGKKARKHYNLESKDNDDIQYNVIVPDEIKMINPSYFLGMFKSSVKDLGYKKFKNKYHFNFNTKELAEDIHEGIEWALDDNVQLI